MFSSSCCYQDCFSLSSVFITMSVVLLLYCYLFLWIYIWNLLSLLLFSLLFLDSQVSFCNIFECCSTPSHFTDCEWWQHKCEIFCTYSLVPLPESLTFVLLSLLLLISCSEYSHSFSTDDFTYSFFCSYINLSIEYFLVLLCFVSFTQFPF